MSIENIVNWYEKNVNYRLTKAFLNFLIKTGIVKQDIDLEILNLYLLERDEDDYVVENNTYQIKKNRIPIISKFKDEIVDKVKKPVVTFTKGSEKKEEKKDTKKFKIELIKKKIIIII